MQINSTTQSQSQFYKGINNTQSQNSAVETKAYEPQETFVAQHKDDVLETAALVGVSGAAFFGIPAALGAAAGAVGVGAVALGTAAVYEMANSMSDENKVAPSEILYAATVMAGITSIGAIGGIAAAATAAAAGAGFALYKAFES